jgi:dienelactone hydrolase
MLLPPHLSTVPEHLLGDIVEWFDCWRTPAASAAPRDGGAIGASLAGERFSETPIQFGPDNRLFGLLTRPASTSSIASTVIFLSTGAGHHVGPHRMYVPLARQWASRGHLVIRFDLGGIGDSLPADGQEAGEPYPAGMLDDVRAAIALAGREAPGRGIVLAGLCSGGWLAFDAARHGLDVDAIATINPPLYLRDGNREWVRQQRRLDRYQRSARDPVKWVKALSRRGATLTALREVGERLRRLARARVGQVLGGAEADDLARDLRVIAGRRVRTLFVFSDGDNGLRYFDQHGVHALSRPEVQMAVERVVVPGAGHAFQPVAAQRALEDLLNRFVLTPG